jgi:hypothetical protein
MRPLLRARSSRAFLVALGLLLIGSIGLWYWAGSKYVHPTDSYYWTQEPSAGDIDIRSPTGRAILGWESRPDWGSPNYRTARDKQQQRCVQPGSPAIPVGAVWRGARLCNAANLNTEQFQIARSYFKTRVDEGYAGMYAKMARDLTWYILGALALWFSLLLAWRIYLWVAAARSKLDEQSGTQE